MARGIAQNPAHQGRGRGTWQTNTLCWYCSSPGHIWARCEKYKEMLARYEKEMLRKRGTKEAPARRTSPSGKWSRPYGMNNIKNWYTDQFRTKLAELNIYAPSSYSKSELKSLYLENFSQRSRPESSEYVPNSDIALLVGDKTKIPWL